MEKRHISSEKGEIIYFLTRKKVKNVNLRIKESDGSVQVSAPYRVSVDFIDGFVAANSDFIFNALERLRAFKEKKKEFLNGDEILYLGKKYTVVAEKSDKNRVEIRENEIAVGGIDLENAEKKKELLEKWLDSERNRVFNEVFEGVFPVFELMGIDKPRLVFKGSASRWGYCQPHKNLIMMNKRLICVPVPLIEYLVLHELTHLVYPDHSKLFWDFMTRLMPDCKKRRNLLKKYGFLL